MRRAPTWRSASMPARTAVVALTFDGGLDVADDDLLVAGAARHHQRPAAVDDEVDAARAEIGRRPAATWAKPFSNSDGRQSSMLQVTPVRPTPSGAKR